MKDDLSSDDLLNAVLDATAEGVRITVGEQGRILVENDRFSDMLADVLDDASDPFGVNEGPDNIEHRPAENAATLWRRIEQLAMKRPAEAHAITLTLWQGRALAVEVLPYRIDGAVAGQVWRLSDVTDRRRAQSEATQARGELAHSARLAMLGQLTASLAHELRQPLTAILSNAQAGCRLLTRDDVDITEIKAILHDIVRDDQRAVDIIQDVRALVRKEPGHSEPVDLNGLILRVAALLNNECEALDVTLYVETDPSLPHVRGLRVELEQVVLNLTMNALEAMRETPVHERLLVVRTLWREAEAEVALRVHDHGCGIAPEQMQRMFEPFFTTKPQGLGLGMPISRDIVERHGGRMEAFPNEDRGITVVVTLPKG